MLEAVRTRYKIRFQDFLFLAGLIVAGLLWYAFGTAPVSNIQTGDLSGAISGVDGKTESRFAVPIHVRWRGEIFGVLAGGRCLALHGEKTNPFFLACVGGGEVGVSEGVIEVEGLWLGVQCGWKDTVFGGRCVPDVLIDSIN